MKHSHWLLCVVIMVGPGKSCHCQTSLKSTSGAASSEIKTYSQSRIELQNLQISKKMLEKSSQFLSTEQPCESKRLDDTLNIYSRSRKHTHVKLAVAVNTEGPLIQVLNDRSVSDGGNLCPL